MVDFDKLVSSLLLLHNIETRIVRKHQVIFFIIGLN